ncbi:MAG: family 16 glycoside hydrolase [Balneolales bacterium]
MFKPIPDRLTLLIGFVLILCCNRHTNANEDISVLPLNKISFEDLDAFNILGDNWKIAGGIQSDYQIKNSMMIQDGTGTLVNVPTANSRNNLFTKLQHGDIELKVEFLIPKGSNSGIYLQGRYEVQIFDSWNVENPVFSDVGGIYQRWDKSRPDGKKGYEGHAPIVNAGFAPGLWQEFHILFRAPRFDDNGNKISNAKFEWINLNGIRVQENIEVTGPTRSAKFNDEVAIAPLMLQGDHGPVAYRNLQYKLFGNSGHLSLKEMQYTIYQHSNRYMPDFDTLKITKEGTTSFLNPDSISQQNDHYAITYSGELDVPVEGNYLFQAQVNNGGDLYINGDRIIHINGQERNATNSNITYLTEGTHQLIFHYFSTGWGGPRLSLWYEGPGIEKSVLGAEIKESTRQIHEPFIIESDSTSSRIGGFINDSGGIRTHVLSIGHPEKVHYSYDLNMVSLISFWKGPFADVSGMWVGRGKSQLLVPLNATIESRIEVPIAQLNTSADLVDQTIFDQLTGKGYTINDDGRPEFSFKYQGISVNDEIYPSGNAYTLIRELQYISNRTHENIVSRIAHADSIELLPNGLYRVDGQYYIRIHKSSGQKASIVDVNEMQTLTIPILMDENKSEVRYDIIW